MARFNFVVDREVRVWKRDFVTIEAENKTEATRMALDDDYISKESEYLLDTEARIEPTDTPTVEVMNEDYELLIDNLNNNRLAKNRDLSSK